MVEDGGLDPGDDVAGHQLVDVGAQDGIIGAGQFPVAGRQGALDQGAVEDEMRDRCVEANRAAEEGEVVPLARGAA